MMSNDPDPSANDGTFGNVFVERDWSPQASRELAWRYHDMFGRFPPMVGVREHPAVRDALVRSALASGSIGPELAKRHQFDEWRMKQLRDGSAIVD